jgi:hypothetical protein
VRVLQLLTVILTALAFVPGGAHLFELPNKIGMSQDDYFAVQSIYRGWALFGVVIFAATGANLLLALMLWRRSKTYRPTLGAALVLAATLVVFFAWTYPANQATANWTVATADWQSLRTQWELTHTANAILTLIALCCTTLSALLLRD